MAITNIASQFSPRRGSKTIMNSSESTQSQIVLAAGELFVEYPDAGVGTGACKIKIGDGSTIYKNLPYAIENDASGATIDFDPDTATTVETALGHVVSGAANSALIAGLKQAVTLLNGETIKSMTVDGNTITVTDNAVSFDSPDYELNASTGSTSNTVTVELAAEAGYGKTSDSFDIGSSSGTLTLTVSSGNINIEANPTGAISGIYSSNLTASKVLVSSTAGKVVASDIDDTELGYLDGTTANIQTQINGKQATITGAASTITDTNLTGDLVLVSSTAGKVAASDITATELGYLDGTSANIQTQLNNKSEVGHTHTEDDITGYIDVAKLYGGASSAGHTINIALIPKAAIETLYVATDEAALRALTSSDVQNGDTVKLADSGLMYFVTHDDALPIGPTAAISTGFEEYTAGQASSVPWSGVTDAPGVFGGATSSAAGTMGFVPAPSTAQVDSYLKGDGTWASFENFSGATTAAAGEAGMVPAPSTAQVESYLCGDGTWKNFVAFSGATSAADGGAGIVPAPTSGQQDYYLKGNGQWTAFVDATTAASGLMGAEDKQAVELLKLGVYDFGDETPTT